MVVTTGRLFTQRQSAVGQFLVCLDSATSDLLWETRYARPWQLQGAYPGPYASPTVDGDAVYFSSPTGLVGCADVTTGELRWTVDVAARFGGRGPDFGFAATPLVMKGLVFFPVGSPAAGLVALDASNGETIWTAGSDKASYCSAMPVHFQGRLCIVGYLENVLLLVDAKDGTVRHRRRLSSGYDEHSAWPLYRSPHLLLTAPFRAPAYRFRVDAVKDQLILKPDWTSKQLSNDVASSVLYKQSVYGFDLRQSQSSAHRPSRGVFRRLDWETGAVLWSAADVGHATVLVADEKLILLTDTGELILARAESDQYDEIGRVMLFPDEICWTPPTLDRGRLYVRSPSRLLCLDLTADRATSPVSVSRPSVMFRRIDPGWLLTREREYPNDAPTNQEATRWFGACLLALGIAAAGTIALRRIVTRMSVPAIFVMLAFLLGFLGPNLASSLADRCLFTWPVSVFAVLVAVTRACVVPPIDTWKARAWIAALVATCLVYFLLCRTVGMSIGWYYLIGQPAALPFVAWAVAEESNRRPVAAANWTLLAFTVFFGAGHAFLLYRGS